MKLGPVLSCVLTFVAFAGCIEAEGGSPAATSGPPAAAPPAAFDENTGGIEGTVYDEESRPLGGVSLAAMSQGAIAASTTSDVAGRFTFSNLAPGAYQVFATSLGYESAAKAIQVVAGELTPTQLLLVRITLIESYHETLPFRGFFDCTWANPTGSGPCGYIGATNGTTGNPLEPMWVNSKRKWNYPVGPNSLTVLHELTWTQGSFATGEKMSVILSHGPLEDGTQRVGTHRYCFATGKDPVLLHWERDEVDDAGECLTGTAQVGGTIAGPPTISPQGMLLQSFVSTGAGANPAGGDLPVGLAYQQPFDLYVSLFYGAVAPEGFTALADG